MSDRDVIFLCKGIFGIGSYIIFRSFVLSIIIAMTASLIFLWIFRLIKPEKEKADYEETSLGEQETG